MFLIAPLLPECDWTKHVEIVEQACRAANITKDRAARIYGTSPQQFDQQIRGIGHFSMRRLFLMPLDGPDGQMFFRAYWLLVAEAAGMGDVADHVRLGALCERVMSRLQVRVLKAQLRERNEDEVA